MMTAHIDDFGTPKAYNHYAVGRCTRWTRRTVDEADAVPHWGGRGNGMIAHWPNGFAARGEILPQFARRDRHRSDGAEAAGLPRPTFVNGVQQTPHAGQSLAYPFRRLLAADPASMISSTSRCSSTTACTTRGGPRYQAPQHPVGDGHGAFRRSTRTSGDFHRPTTTRKRRHRGGESAEEARRAPAGCS